MTVARRGACLIVQNFWEQSRTVRKHVLECVHAGEDDAPKIWTYGEVVYAIRIGHPWGEALYFAWLNAALPRVGFVEESRPSEHRQVSKQVYWWPGDFSTADRAGRVRVALGRPGRHLYRTLVGAGLKDTSESCVNYRNLKAAWDDMAQALANLSPGTRFLLLSVRANPADAEPYD